MDAPIANGYLHQANGKSHSFDDYGSVDSNFDPPNGNSDETSFTSVTGAGVEVGGGGGDYDDVDIETSIIKAPTGPSSPTKVSEGLAITFDDEERYDAAAIRKEFQRYQSVLPKPDKLLQEQHSVQALRNLIIEASNHNTSNVTELPKFLKHQFEGGVKPHHALCCLLLNDYYHTSDEEADGESGGGMISQLYSSLVRILSLGLLYRQLNNPAHFIRDQFYRVAPAVPTDIIVKPHVLREKIRNRGLPIPNYFLDPEDTKQFPPHIALLVILQDECEDGHEVFGNIWYRMGFAIFAFVAFVVRVVLEVIGGAGAIWGGSEVFNLRLGADYPELQEFWRWTSIAVGVLCLLRFTVVNVPQKEDEGDILGPAGPWSLRTPVRFRTVCEHPFHYFVRALPPFAPYNTSSSKKLI